MLHRLRLKLIATLFFCCATLNTQSLAQQVDPESQSRSAFYQADTVQAIHLKITEEDRQRMMAALPKRIYVPATFRWRDIEKEVAIRFKGNSSSQPGQQHKRSFLIRFDKYDKDNRFLGMQRVSFDNGIQFGSLFSEQIITEILRDIGIKTHRCNFATIRLNDKNLGVYVNVERIDETFLRREFGEPIGPLFKVDEGGPGCNLQFLGLDPNAYKQTFEAKSDAAKKQHARIGKLAQLINKSPKTEFGEQLEEHIELEDFLRTSAVMLLSGAFDQLTGWNPHNYYLYFDGERNRWRYLPWDLDVGFSETAFGRIKVLDDWNAAWPVANNAGPNPLMERIIGDPKLLARYRKHAEAILEKYFQPDRLNRALDAKYELIKADLQKDPFPHRRVTSPQDRGYDQIVASMKTFFHKRYSSAKQQLASPGPKPKIVRSQGHGPPPELIEQIRSIEKRARELQREGRDVSPIAKIMQRVGPLLQQKKMDEAKKLLEEAKKLLQ